MKLKQIAIALSTLAYGRRQRKADTDQPTRMIPAARPDSRAEYLVTGLLLLAALFAAAFIVSYAELHATKTLNLLLGVCLAGALASIAAALIVVSRRLIVTEELEDDYPQEHPREQREVTQLVHESASAITRRKLIVGAAATAGGVLGLAGLTPVLSLGPLWDTAPLDASPWHRGRRLVDADGNPMLASDIEEETFYSAFPERADPETIGSPLVLVRMKLSELKLPAGRTGWAPDGILAYSRICTHAGCAIELYSKPRFPALEPKPALVCPCHYSTFDPATGATVIFGPAGRPLPQLPLMIDGTGHLAAAGDFSGRVGPAWWGVREKPS
ncbi:MAG TPA: Rieske (2Fe-2S) protein [Solirubrobacteraceae bacterium]|jgi:ubiquinol-cytochrome c reductase iron-sulfur subunit